jgi:hypothetical protein
VTVDYGSDWFNTSDVDPRMPTITGRQVPIQRLVRRLYTPRGSCPDAPNDGIDVRDLLNRPTLTVEQAQGLIRGELQKDSAVLSITVQVTYSGNFGRQTMRIDIDGTLSDGPFALVISVTDLTVELLSAT